MTSSSLNNNWTEQLRTALKSPQETAAFFNLASNHFPLEYKSFLPLEFAYRIKKHGPDSPLWKQFIPSEVEKFDEGMIDPIGDKNFAKSGGVIHRYKNRILFTPTPNCPVSCRYCFRKNGLNNNDEIFKRNLSFLKEYLAENSQIDEVILTGGDPLMLSNIQLKKVIESIIGTQIKFLRFHTRMPIIIPQRIDKGFIELLNFCNSYFVKTIFVLHANHISEFNNEVQNSLEKLAASKADCLTQSVLLKNVNNKTQDLIELFNKIVSLGFRPYYLHHPDQVKGAMHFYLSLEEGRLIYNQLRDQLSGWMLPHYVVDLPQGRGKQLAFNPESIKFSGNILDRMGQNCSYKIEQNFL